MPTYTFRNLDTGEFEEHVMRMSELDAFKEANPRLERALVDTPNFGDPVRMGRVKPDNGFKEVLQKISERAPGGKVLRDNIR
jgi:hypothetical protein